MRRGLAPPLLALVLTSGAAGCEPASTPAPSPTPAPSMEAGDLTLSDLVVAEPVTGERTAFYMTVRNRGVADDALVAVGGDAVRAGSLHRTEREGDVARMRSVPEIPVPAGGEARLRPGGSHGMLEGIGGTWRAGDTVTVRLRFRRAGPVEAPALVVSYAGLPERFRTSGADEAPGGDR